jgi:nucleoside diphosphate kinase
MARFEAERTYIMIKPDGVQRGLVGEIISRFERKGFVLKGLKQFTCPQKLAEEHYKVRVRLSGCIAKRLRSQTALLTPPAAGPVGQAFLQGPGCVHYLRPRGCDGVGGPGRRQVGAQADRRHQPAGG